MQPVYSTSMPQSWRRPQHHKRTFAVQKVMSALPPKADIGGANRNVREELGRLRLTGIGAALLSIQQSLYSHERWSALVLNEDHQEFRRLGTACVPVNDMNFVGAFIEGLSWCQCYLLSTLQLHHNGALQHKNKGMSIVSVDRARPA